MVVFARPLPQRKLTTLNHAAYPHIFESILSSVTDWSTLLTLRQVSQPLQRHVDSIIFSHLTISSLASSYILTGSGAGSLPGPPTDPTTPIWTERLSHLRLLDVLESTPPHPSPIPLAQQLLTSAPNLKMIRRATPTAPDICPAPTIVDVVDLTKSFWGNRAPMVWVNTQVRDVDKHVVVVRCDGGLWPIVSMAQTWDAKHVVFIFRPSTGEGVRQPSNFRSSFAAAFISLAVYHKYTRFTFVGLGDLPSEMVGVESVHDAARQLALILPANEGYYRPEMECEALPIGERLEFLSSNEYEKSVGSDVWELEKWDEAPPRCLGCSPVCAHV